TSASSPSRITKDLWVNSSHTRQLMVNQVGRRPESPPSTRSAAFTRLHSGSTPMSLLASFSLTPWASYSCENRAASFATPAAVDEPFDALGQSLKLPEWLEPRRFEIEALLPNIHAPLELRGPNA